LAFGVWGLGFGVLRFVICDFDSKRYQQISNKKFILHSFVRWLGKTRTFVLKQQTPNNKHQNDIITNQ